MTYYISQGRVETLIRRGGRLCCSSVAYLLQYLYAKHQNTMRFDKVIPKIKGCNFLPHSVVFVAKKTSFISFKHGQPIKIICTDIT